MALSENTKCAFNQDVENPTTATSKKRPFDEVDTTDITERQCAFSQDVKNPVAATSKNRPLHAVGNSAGKKRKCDRLPKAMCAKRECDRPRGLTCLPEEVRERIFRQVLVTKEPINFASRRNFEKSAALLRTSRAIYNQAIPILYGENSFFFERTAEHAFREVRSFFDKLPTQNIGLLKFVSFAFTDALYGFGPDEARFVTDPNLHHCLCLLSQHATLNRICVTFAGKKVIRQSTDRNFIDILASVKSREVIHAPYHGKHKSKDTFRIFEIHLKNQMTADKDPNVDLKRVKLMGRKMEHERPRALPYKFTN